MSSLRKLRWTAQKTARKVYYWTTISQEKHREALARVQDFAGDFVARLDDPSFLTTLRPSGEQQKSLQTIIDETREGNMRLLGNCDVSHDSFPVLTARYSNYSLEDGVDIFGSTAHVVLGATYNHDTKLPTKAYFFGYSSHWPVPIAHDIHFLLSPQKITSENLGLIFGKSALRKEEITVDGSRITTVRRIEETEETSVYHLLGTMESKSLGVELFVYGFNEKNLHSAEKEREPGGEHSPSLT
ncbi:MAG: hypothetical protein A2649_01675 [Candidatus Yanofskybacteria bacterium RIFCSPHIGHO2_01_FULL_41_26]|uniref:Uncharacterized protein n=1 Tax=Candidatus Yanofskybacteria bacterium RIFCSPHIGHO2_01_FULL_41_26 TaxID=1802661 RepID=A0A1F8EGC8_9BACT|nr:MAG: hypothetical protein A2649_01675 [Candidatus Yanofskybacteria bacterium RIFCSPHIGHO2_01_FULL_41_26]